MFAGRIRTRLWLRYWFGGGRPALVRWCARRVARRAPLVYYITPVLCAGCISRPKMPTAPAPLSPPKRAHGQSGPATSRGVASCSGVRSECRRSRCGGYARRLGLLRVLRRGREGRSGYLLERRSPQIALMTCFSPALLELPGRRIFSEKVRYSRYDSPLALHRIAKETSTNQWRTYPLLHEFVTVVLKRGLAPITHQPKMPRREYPGRCPHPLLLGQGICMSKG